MPAPFWKQWFVLHSKLVVSFYYLFISPPVRFICNFYLLNDFCQARFFSLCKGLRKFSPSFSSQFKKESSCSWWWPCPYLWDRDYVRICLRKMNARFVVDDHWFEISPEQHEWHWLLKIMIKTSVPRLRKKLTEITWRMIFLL